MRKRRGISRARTSREIGVEEGGTKGCAGFEEAIEGKKQASGKGVGQSVAYPGETLDTGGTSIFKKGEAVLRN